MRQTLLKAILAVGMDARAKTMPSRQEDIMSPAKCSTVHRVYPTRVEGLCIAQAVGMAGWSWGWGLPATRLGANSAHPIACKCSRTEAGQCCLLQLLF